jgi:hypothetical protein
MAKILITTQVYENYGAHDWNGTGECPQHWRAKGGFDYVVKNITKLGNVTDIVMSVRGSVESDNDYIRESIVDWSVVSDDYLTDFEKDQLEYEGVIRFPVKELEIA